MNPEIKQKWIEALKSGEYKQTDGKLRQDNRFCCLGVLCDIIDPSKWDGEGYDGFLGVPPYKLLDSINLSEDKCLVLARMNDEGAKFTRIANYIEENI